MSTLVMDISNGRTKLALACGGELVSPVRVCPTAELTAQRVALLCEGWRFMRFAYCSVVPGVAAVAESAFASRLPVMRVCPGENLPVAWHHYEGLATLGADRVANVVAAVRLHPRKALVVIDAGTAMTADVVLPGDKDGEKPRFCGGVIAPGVGTMLRSLHSGTAQLPAVPLALPAHAVGRSTVEAMQSGCVRGYRGLLREILSGMERECGCCLQPVLTGGDAPLLARIVPELPAPDPMLTLRGIALCAEFEMQEN